MSWLKDFIWRFLYKDTDVYRIPSMIAQLEQRSSADAEYARGFNARTRDEWVEDRAKSVPPGSRVLDVGAGTAPYRGLFGLQQRRFPHYRNGFRHGAHG